MAAFLAVVTPRQPTGWGLARLLAAPSPTDQTGFGRCLSLDAHLLLVTASGSSAYLYQRQTTGMSGSVWWGLASTLTDPYNMTAGFGAECGLQGGSILVSSPAQQGMCLS